MPLPPFSNPKSYLLVCGFRGAGQLAVSDRILSMIVRGPRDKFAWITFVVCVLGLVSLALGHRAITAVAAVSGPLCLFIAWARGEFLLNHVGTYKQGERRFILGLEWMRREETSAL
jgi:hypothetical protein